ncbi:hypothetical protein [Burkholderia ubonensis]|uniref:hypothetical protein n=1 Tax=Burkholderia ubonensis TaxID=101571 RepID=UPI0012F86117|nr:hypothetical protein [Burkholderia ubonensis]
MAHIRDVAKRRVSKVDDSTTMDLVSRLLILAAPSGPEDLDSYIRMFESAAFALIGRYFYGNDRIAARAAYRNGFRDGLGGVNLEISRLKLVDPLEANISSNILEMLRNEGWSHGAEIERRFRDFQSS